MPHLLYCLPIFGHSKQATTLFKCQKWALRTIRRSHWKSHTNKIFQKYNILKLQEMYELSICMIIRKRIDNHGPALLQEIYNYKNMRNKHYITTEKPFSKKLDTFPNFIFPKIWNKFNKLDLKPSINSYKENLKTYQINSYRLQKCHKPNCYNCSVTKI